MANKYIGDICFSNGEYEKDGEKKKRWVKAGPAFENENGDISFKLELMPTVANEWSGFMRLFKKDDVTDTKSGYDKAREAANKLREPESDEYNTKVDLSSIPF